MKVIKRILLAIVYQSSTINCLRTRLIILSRYLSSTPSRMVLTTGKTMSNCSTMAWWEKRIGVAFPFPVAGSISASTAGNTSGSLRN